MLAEHHRQRTADGGRRTADPWARRGVTLVEMLVTVAVLVIIMTILVQIFQAATGSVSAAQAYQQLDDQLRRLDGMLRGDLEGVTARFTPPLDPAQNLGYFEYGENEFADLQGEDSDDYIRFTAKAPPGKPFTGRFWPNPWTNGGQVFGSNTNNLAAFPITITSDYAEIIYFLRNGNLYRRVLLVAPQLQSAILPAISTGNGHNQGVLPDGTFYAFQPSILGGAIVSWQGVNDVSARPAGTGPNAAAIQQLPAGQRELAHAQSTILLNTLGDLTNREKRFAYMRCADDYLTATPNGGTSPGPDGVPDDVNQDNVPDQYPTLYTNILNTGLIHAPRYQGNGNAPLNFPYVFPGAYSRAQALPNVGFQCGWIHAPAPYAVDAAGNSHAFDSTPLLYLQNINHNPLDQGDNLPIPPRGGLPGGASDWQTWWGFPTWRETLSASWADPTWQLNVNHSEPVGLQNLFGLQNGKVFYSGVLPAGNPSLLPPMADPGNLQVSFSTFRQSPQLFCDGAGASSSFWTGANNLLLWSQDWEDDLIMTGVRSFDVKAYDNALVGYADLGWGDDFRLVQNATDPNYAKATLPQAPYLTGTYDELTGSYQVPAIKFANNQSFDLLNQTFAHEGRMPPLTADFRFDAQYGAATYPVQNNGYTGNIGDDDVHQVGVIRLRRVWDSWSTDYSRAPGTGVDKFNGGFPWGPPFSQPIYPSYPPPYPAPLRGIQVQVRVVDPSNQRIKSLTIRQDFTDKL